MIATRLYWVEGPWRGKLALAARPRGGEWLEDEISSWQRQGIDTVFSLLTEQEQRDLDIAHEEAEATSHGLAFFSYPILDRQVPESEADLARALQKLESELERGRNVVLHCRQGIGRTGLVAACLLVTKGIDPESAVARLSAVRGIPVPETPEQRSWIDRYAETLVRPR